MCLRWYSHEALATRRVLADYRWMAALGDTVKEQVTWIEDLVNKVMSRNKTRAGEYRPPLTYNEIRDVAKSLLTQKGKAESALFGSSSIYTNKTKKESELEKKLEAKTKEVATLKEQLQAARGGQGSKQGGQQAGRGAGGGARGRGRGRGGGGGQTGLSRGGVGLEQKRDWTCKKYNSQAGCSDPCPDSKKHLCSFEEGSYMCWGPHKSSECHRRNNVS